MKSDLEMGVTPPIPVISILHDNLALMEKNQLIRSKVKIKWRQPFIYTSVFLM